MLTAHKETKACVQTPCLARGTERGAQQDDEWGLITLIEATALKYPSQ